MSTVLSTCNCCKEILGPNTIYNVPGLSAIAYRIGTHATFKSSMIKDISKQIPLSKLTTRDDDDPTIALMDSWAMVLDVLSFYQERIANEGYLKTAAERRSVFEMAQAIGYELHPGVAAETYLAFNLETTTGSPESALINKGTKAQTVPGQDETPQVFETIEDIHAYREWNEIKVKSSELWKPAMNKQSVYLKGTSTNLKKGDAILIVGEEREKNTGNENWDFRRIMKVETVNSTDSEKSYTRLTLERKLGSYFPWVEPAKESPKVFALRQCANLFGYNAPDWRIIPQDIRDKYGSEATEWPNFNIAYLRTVPDKLDIIYLDTIYPQFVKDSWIVLSIPGTERLRAEDNKEKTEYEEIYRIEEVSTDSLTNFTLTSKCTKLKLSGENLKEKFGKELRRVVVYGQSEKLEIAEEPLNDPVSGDSITLGTKVSGLFENQNLIITGREKNSETVVKEVVSIKKNPKNDILYLNSALKYKYEPDSVVINANVAKATHGETKKEILGSGDGARTFQEFQLKQVPLTYTSSFLPGGCVTTLEVRVNEILWEEVPSLNNVSANEKVYVTRRTDDGMVTVRFGDGINGARLPTGVENVTAKYRVGTGLNGLVRAAQISLLMTRPLGVKNVINPIAPSGAADPQTLEEAKVNAPLTVLTMDRIVSLQDYEDFTRAFAGIGKAISASIWLGENQFVHLTFAGVNGSKIETSSELYKNLLAGIDNARHPDVTVKVDNYTPLFFNIEAKIYINNLYNTDSVIQSVKKELLNTFSFDKRSVGQALSLSEVVAVLQSIEGVVYPDLEYLYINTRSKLLKTRLLARTARMKDNSIKPAELITINPGGIALTGISQ